jgi:hypothetical protein
MFNTLRGAAFAVATMGVSACGGTVSHSPAAGGASSSGGMIGNASGSIGASADGHAAQSQGGAAGPEASGGAAPVGSSLVDVSNPWPSSGCDLPLPAEQVPTIPGSRTGYTEWHVTQTGATLGSDDPTRAGDRQFFVRVPADYDPNRPYRVVYLGSGCGAEHAGAKTTYALFDEAQGGTEQAVYVGLSVPDNDANPGCYDNNTGPQSQEWEAFDLIHSFVESHYCVDNNRIFVAGYSTGAWVANMYGYYFAGLPSPPLDDPERMQALPARKFSPHWAVRGGAGVNGSLSSNQPQPCNGPAAHFWIYDATDQALNTESRFFAFNLALKTNGCNGNYRGPKKPWAPAENIPGLENGVCQEYTGCPADIAKNYPIVYCTTSGLGHSDQAAHAIAAFNQFYASMDAPQP